MNWTYEDIKSGQLLATDRLEMAEISIPQLLAVYNHWDHVRGEKFAPSLGEFRLEDLPPGIVPSMVIVDILGPPLDYYYRFFGTRMVEHAGFDLSHKTYFADNIQGYGFVNAEMFPIVIKERKPIATMSRWVSIRGLNFTTTTIRFPLSANGDEVTHAGSVNHIQLASHKTDE